LKGGLRGGKEPGEENDIIYGSSDYPRRDGWTWPPRGSVLGRGDQERNEGPQAITESKGKKKYKPKRREVVRAGHRGATRKVLSGAGRPHLLKRSQSLLVFTQQSN